MTDSGASIPLWCPRCLTTGGELEHCPSCGLPQRGPAVARLREVVSRGAVVRQERERLASEQVALTDEHERLLQRLGATVPAPLPMPPPPVTWAPEWRPERVRDVLLWLGVTLLALAAVTFTAVAWARLGDGGRAGLLVGFTVLAGLGAVWLRSRLEATAEAFAGLTLALVFVDCIAARRAGLGDGLAVVTWAIPALGVTALVALGAAKLRLNTGRATAPPLGLAAAVAALAVVAHEGWTISIGASALACVAVAGAAFLDRSRDWRTAAAILAFGAGALSTAALIAAFTGWVTADEPPEPALLDLDLWRPVRSEDFLSGVAFVTAASAPILAVVLSVRVRAMAWLTSVLVGTATAIVIGGATMAIDVDDEARLAWAAGFSAAAFLGARLGAPRFRDGLAGAGVISLAVLSLFRLGPMIDSVFGPFAWSDDPWSRQLAGEAAAALEPTFGAGAFAVPLGTAIAALIATLPIGRTRPLVSPTVGSLIAASASALVVSVGVVVADLSVGAALVVELSGAVALLGVAVLADRRATLEAFAACSVAAAILVVPAFGWALGTRTATSVFLSVVLVATAGAFLATRRSWARAVLASLAAVSLLARTGVAVIELDGSNEAAGFAVAVAGAVVMLLGTPLRRREPEGVVLELIGLGGLLVGALLAGPSPEWLAASVTVAPPAFAASAAGDADRRWYGWFALTTAVVAVWAWLFAADVALVEAYTLPAAAAALAAGVIVWRTDDDPDSIVDFGPGLLIAFGPTLIAVLERGGVARSLPLTVAAFIAVVVGARLRLRGPILLGAATLVVLAVDVLAPVAARVPRWIVLAVAGAVLLWLGSTAERRLRDARRFRNAYNRLG